MGRRGGGGMRGGGGRGSLGGGMRTSGGRGTLGGGRSGGLGSGTRGGIGGNTGGGLGGGLRAPAPRRAAPPRRGGNLGSFGLGVGTGMLLSGGRRRRGWGGGFGRRHVGGGFGPPMRRGRGGGGGCATIILIVIIVFIFISILGWIGNLNLPGGGSSGADNIPRPTHVREALPPSMATHVGPMFTDRLNWIGNASVLEAGLSDFLRVTGVRPHLYLTGIIDGTPFPTPSQVSAFAQRMYTQLTPDEAHILVVFFENDDGEYYIYAVAGNQAQIVMDGEAIDILAASIQFYYYDQALTEEQFLANGFRRAGNRIMESPPNNRVIWVTLIIVAGVLLAGFLGYTWWKKKQDQKNLEAEQKERILSQDLETFGGSGDDEAGRLARQYEDDNN